ncbi:hypothetical protein BH18ACT11_BH18ACT11_19240 [soil metagenome]
MRMSSGQPVDVGVSGVCEGISILLVFWWVFFLESLSGIGPLLGMPSWRAQA